MSYITTFIIFSSRMEIFWNWIIQIHLKKWPKWTESREICSKHSRLLRRRRRQATWWTAGQMDLELQQCLLALLSLGPCCVLQPPSHNQLTTAKTANKLCINISKANGPYTKQYYRTVPPVRLSIGLKQKLEEISHLKEIFLIKSVTDTAIFGHKVKIQGYMGQRKF